MKKKENKKEEKKIKYNVFSTRLHEDTVKLLIKKRTESGLSWNRFIYQLIKEK